jgi:hypothetical protein
MGSGPRAAERPQRSVGVGGEALRGPLHHGDSARPGDLAAEPHDLHAKPRLGLLGQLRVGHHGAQPGDPYASFLGGSRRVGRDTAAA